MSRMGDTADSGMNLGTSGGGSGAGDQGQQTPALSEKATQVSQNIREMGQQARDVATEKYDQLRGQAEEYYEQGREKAVEWEQSLEAYVHEKPLQSLLIAAGVGVVLGLLWKRS
jgi:ElaB/YqjD/DUF883 family membrane-anchored ribosome-binding protein